VDEGGNFRTWVHPIPELGTKRVRFGYQEVFRKSDQGLRYRLSLGFKDKLSRFSFSILATQASEKSVFSEGGDSSLTLKQLSENEWKLKMGQNCYNTTHVIELSISVEIQALISTEKGPTGRLSRLFIAAVVTVQAEIFTNWW
jgi:hypothetical protein